MALKATKWKQISLKAQNKVITKQIKLEKHWWYFIPLRFFIYSQSYPNKIY